MTAHWQDFAAAQPAMAEAGERLLRPRGKGVAYLATVRKDGGPRVHPVMPVLAGGRLYVFVVRMSWKYRDLVRDGRYALHSAPSTEAGHEFYLTGPAREVEDAGTRAAVTAASGGRLGIHDFEALFELGIERALHTKWENWGTAAAWPSYAKWAAG
ncbi:MAG: pyridoxamine 5'-phosphate oxidase family protein [Dehalococcoidia bacterium]|nr:pyridoxamine 5'-phosphate oxidase family protein [Dehalococcoidia bacterium]